MLRSDFAESCKKDMYKSFLEGEQYDDYKPKYQDIFSVEKSTAAYEKSTSIIGQGELTETTEGQDAPVRPAKEGWTTLGKNRSFKEAYVITRENQDDLQKVKGILKKLAYGWGKNWGITRDTLAAKVFNYGAIAAGNAVFNNAIPNVIADSTGNVIYDSIALFNLTGNKRTTKVGNEYYNHIGISGVDLTIANIKTAYNLMAITNAYNEDGMKISLIPDTLLIPPSLGFTADQIINSTLLPGGANNDKNPLKGKLNIIEWPALTDTDGWFIGKAKKGLVFQERMGLEIDFFEDKKNHNWEANCMARAGVRVDNWRFWIAANVATT